MQNCYYCINPFFSSAQLALLSALLLVSLNNERPNKFPGYQLLVILLDSDIQLLESVATNKHVDGTVTMQGCQQA